MKKLATRIKITFGLSVAGILATGFITHSNIEKINETRQWVEHTHEVIAEQESLHTALRELESNARGFTVTANDKFLSNENLVRSQIDEHYKKLVELTADNEQQVANLARLRPLLTRRTEELRALVETRKTQGFDAACRKVRLPMSDLDADIRKAMTDIRDEEQRLLKLRTAETLKTVENTEVATMGGAIAAMLVVSMMAAYVIASLNRSIGGLVKGTEKVAQGDLEHRIDLAGFYEEFGMLGRAFNIMIDRLRAFEDENKERLWMKSNLNLIGSRIQGQRSLTELSELFLSEISPLIGAHHAALYIIEDGSKSRDLRLFGSYAGNGSNGSLAQTIKRGEGLIGQCCADKKQIVLTDVPAASFVVKSALVESTASYVIIQPILFEDEIKGVLELASLGSFKPIHLTLIEELATALGVSVNSVETTLVTDNLLKESQQLNEELQAQQEELETQQDELRRTNAELEENAEALDMQNQEISDKNVELEQMQLTLEERANELSLASKYKSDFLANMSHDLRTPLNSLMIFSELLAANDEGNLEKHQVEYANNAYLAGKTLLTLVDDILDLSKIESGTVTLDVIPINVRERIAEVKSVFSKLAEDKGLVFQVKVDDDVPEIIRTDQKRFMQVLNNLLSNAFKFTAKGGVSLTVSMKPPRPGDPSYKSDEKLITFAISDTGIGIPEDKHGLIFEAFRQADPQTKKKYGGTGLGLAICREICDILHGYIDLVSMPEKGSTFTLCLPLSVEPQISPPGQRIPFSPANMRQGSFPHSFKNAVDEKLILQNEIPDDRHNINPGDRIMVLIEDDPSFARMLLEAARNQEFKGLVALRGSEGLALARRFIPDGITLDLRLPDMDGWVVLDQLKAQAETRHIPVHIISVDERHQRGMEMGAIGFLEKPVTLESVNDAIKRIKSSLTKENGTLLIAESDETLRTAFNDLLNDEDVHTISVANAAEALNTVQSKKVDCLVVALELADMSGLSLIEQLQERSNSESPPIIVYGNRELRADEVTRLERLKETSIVKDVDTPERLLSEVVLFMHRVEAALPEPKRRLIAKVRQQDSTLAGKKILIVDDDPRNIAALTGALQRHELNIITADNGVRALEVLNEHPDVDLVLMDIMMPEMDGYEATQAIRKQERFYRLPVIAVTAKAMKEDRRKCLEAGASDYIAKPVDRNQLLSLMRVWLYENKKS